MLRVFHHYVSARKVLLFLVEGAVMAGASAAGAAVLSRVLAPAGALGAAHPLPALGMLVAVLVAVQQFALYLHDLYDLRLAGEDRLRGTRLLKAAGWAALAVGLVLLALPRELPMRLPPGALLGGMAGALLGSLGVRLALRVVVGPLGRVLVLGSGPAARAVAEALESSGERLQAAAVVDPRPGACGPVEPVDVLARRLQARYVVLAPPEPCEQQVEALLRCRLEGRRVYDAPGFCERVLRRVPVQLLQAMDFVLQAEELTVSPWRLALKRTSDVLAASLLLLLTWPLLVLVALAIKLDSPGPVFYRQERVGRGGRTYWLWKFRSMRTDAEQGGAVWARPNDSRVTRVGRLLRRTRMDEIPQVFNVLCGDMSFVGPRPERPVFVNQLERLIPLYGLRHTVKPGITGWAQLRYPYGASVEDARNKLEFDLYYVRNGTLFLDVLIIFHTVRHVLLGRGAR